INLDRRALPDLAIDLDVAAGLLDEAVHLAQPKAGALPELLGGEERLEGAIDYLAGHAGAGVADANGDVLAGRQIGIDTAILLIGIDVGAFYRQLAAGRHGVARVDGEIDERRLEVVGIDFDVPQAR